MSVTDMLQHQRKEPATSWSLKFCLSWMIWLSVPPLTPASVARGGGPAGDEANPVPRLALHRQQYYLRTCHDHQKRFSTVCTQSVCGLLSYLSKAGCTESQEAHKLTHAHQNAQQLLSTCTSRHKHTHIILNKHKVRHINMYDRLFFPSITWVEISTWKVISV